MRRLGGNRAGMRRLGRNRAGWRAVGYAFALPFWGILTFAAAAVWACGIAALLYPIWRWLWPLQAGSYGTVTSAAGLAWISAAGLLVTIAGAWVVRAAARLDAWLVRRMLGPSPADDLRAKLDERRVEEPAAPAAPEPEPEPEAGDRRADVHARARAAMDELKD